MRMEEIPMANQHTHLYVLGRFDLVVRSESVSVGMSCRRLLALLAIRGCRLSRLQVAGVLWPNVSGGRASANLRSALWRLQRGSMGVVNTTFSDLWLAPDVEVDIHRAHVIAQRLIDRSGTLTRNELREALRSNLYDDIFPEAGDEEWLTVEAERHRQLRIHALEGLAEQLIEIGWFGGAVEAALGACRADLFRESARRLLVSSYLAEGNPVEAWRQHAAYCALLREELGVEPPDSFLRLLDGTDGGALRLSGPQAAVLRRR